MEVSDSDLRRLGGLWGGAYGDKATLKEWRAWCYNTLSNAKLFDLPDDPVKHSEHRLMEHHQS